jgi:diguanylate cyclase (GGDEF)-like protein
VSLVTSPRTPVFVTAVVVVGFSTAMVPVMHDQLIASPSFIPVLIGAVTVFDLMSVYLLAGDFRDRGDLRILVTTLAYAWSLTMMLGYALAFPDAVRADPPLAFTPSTAAYLYLTWHCGFPVLLGLAWAPWPTRFNRVVPTRIRLRLAVALTAGFAALGVGIVVLFGIFADTLPVLIDGFDTSRMTSLTAPYVLPVVLVAFACTVSGTWSRTGAERWVPVAALACICDLGLTYAARSRFSAGWYAGRSLTVVATGVVLIAMLASFRRLKAQADRDALLDPLTHLSNRRGALAALELMILQARRTGNPLAVITLDLDWFKAVNDQAGHEAGDRVLVEVGQVLTSCSRGGDVAARLGGEEFLVILHDTDGAAVLVAAERLRSLISAVVVPRVSATVTASVGATVLEPGDLNPAAVLRRADAALYDAKRNGRNRVESRFLGSLAMS